MIPSGWLELPSGAGFGATSAAASNSSYYKGVFGSGKDRNYSYLYQYGTYTSLWTAYPLYSSVMSSSAPDASYVNHGWRAPMKPEAVGNSNRLNRGTFQSISSDEYSGGWNENPKVSKSYQVNIWDGSYNVILGQTDWVENASASCGSDGDYYACGHQIPNADRNLSDAKAAETYYATNSTPQIQKKFNAKIWSALEKGVRDCARGGGSNDTLYVVTGAVFHKSDGSDSSLPITYIHPKKDSSKSVPVPNYYWIVLLKVKWNSSGEVTSASMIGFWLPHEQYSSNDYTPYVKSVAQIETWTGFSFFANLPETLKSAAKANTSWTAFQSF